MADMDQTTLMALAATGVAVVGAAVLYATQAPAPAPAKKSGKKNKGKKNRKKSNGSESKPVAAPAAYDDDEEEEAVPAQAPQKKKKKSSKKKRRHKGRKKKSGNNGNMANQQIHEEDKGIFFQTSEDDLEGDEWVTKQAKPKKTRSNRKTASEEGQDDDGQPQREKIPEIKMEVGDAVPAIIGKGGKTIQGLQDATGARLSIDRGSTTLSISGTTEQIEVAKKKVEEIMAQRAQRDARPAQVAPAHSVTIRDLGDAIGMVIGKGGSTIKQIEAETGTRLNISREDDSLTISGDKENVEAAQEKVNAIIASRKERGEGGMRSSGAPRPPIGSASATLELGDRRTMFAIIGRGGSQVRQIEQESGARVSIDKDNATCTISGSDEQVEMARGMVKAVMENSVQSSVQITLTNQNIGSVIGKGGSTIRRITDESGARLDIKRGDEIILEIVGSDEAVEAARKEVEAVLAAAAESRSGGGRGPAGPKDGEIEFTIELGDSVGSVIGRGGETIRRIQSESGARLNIQRPGSECRIIGTEEAVEAAKTQVQDILNRQAERAQRDAARQAAREQAVEAEPAGGEADWGVPAEEGEGSGW